jgi:hypothetical protein
LVIRASAREPLQGPYVPFGAPLRTSRSDVRCARYGASVGTPASTGVLRAPAAKAKGADAAVGTVA